MKKFLSLLSVLTTSGSAVPNVIAAASPYKKENNINSDINLHTNNLKILNRNKRENNNINISVNEINDFSAVEEIIKKIQYNNKIYLLAINYSGGADSRINRVLYEIKNNFITIIMSNNDEVEKINYFCIDSDDNIYIATDLGLYKRDKYNIINKISNIKIETIGVDNEGKILFEIKEDYNINILTKDKVQNFPKERTDLINIKKIKLISDSGGYMTPNGLKFKSVNCKCKCSTLLKKNKVLFIL